MRRASAIYNKLEEILLVASLAFTVAIIFYQVVMRYVFNDSPSWTEEVARYVFIWQIWLGTSVAMKGGKHIRVELVNGLFVKKNRLIGKNLMEILILLLWISLTVFLTVGGIAYVLTLHERGALSPGIRVPLMYVYAAVPVSCFAVTIRLLALLVREFGKMKRGGEA
jgi:TRAP-type C4-dicarboxylate transport system permease small subunit